MRAVLCALVVCVGTLSAQQTVFKGHTELVRVDTVVVDKDGHAVRGLKASDFALFDRKKPQAIETFDEVSHARTDADADTPALPLALKRDVATNAAIQADRLVIVVVDDLHIFKGRTDKAKDVARDVVTKLGDHASMAVLFTSGEGSTLVTQDRSELFAAIDAMKARQTFRRPNEAKDEQRAALVDPEAPAEVKLAAVNAAQRTSLEQFMENMQEFNAIRDAAAMLRPEDQRRKSFVLVSEGLQKYMGGVFDSSGNPSEILAGNGGAGMAQPPTIGYHNDALRTMMRSMWESSVALYAIDPRGNVGPANIMLEAWPPPTCSACENPAELPKAGDKPANLDESTNSWTNAVRLAQGALVSMAKASGGFAITDTDDLAGGVDKIVEDIDHYYVLGFYATDTTSENYRPLKVTVPGHPEYTVRFRLGYIPHASAPKPRNADPLVDLSAGVMPKGDLPLRLTALPLVGTGALASVAVELEITAPTGAMKDADGKLRDDVTYSVIVIDDKKAKVISRTGSAARFALHGRDDAQVLPDSVTYQIPITLDLAPGKYELRASAVSARLDKGGSVYLTVIVPDFPSAPLAVSGIALGFAEGARVPVGRPISDAPAASRVPFDQTLTREFTADDTLRAYFEVARRDPSTSVAVAVAVVDASDKTVLTIDESVAPHQPGRVEVRVPLSLVGKGAFRLRATATDSRAVAKSETGFIVR